MSSQPTRHPASSSSLTAGLAVVSALIGLFSAAVFLGLDATLALEGTGRYRLVANLAWVGVVLAVVGAVLVVWWAFVYGRHNGQRLCWGGWVVLVQLLIVLFAFGAVAYGDLRTMLYLPLVLGLICNGALLLATWSTP
ncbi:MAG: hypothetical protein R3E79_18170 [Caldilineaceae bacterium]